MPFLAPILSWLGNLIGGPLVKSALDAYRSKLAADGAADKITADLAARELAVEQREKEVDASILIAEQGNWITRSVRPLWALPFVIWTWKVVVWDIVLGHGSTPELHGFVANLGVTIATAYFGGRSLEKVASIIAARKK